MKLIGTSLISILFLSIKVVSGESSGYNNVALIRKMMLRDLQKAPKVSDPQQFIFQASPHKFQPPNHYADLATPRCLLSQPRSPGPRPHLADTDAH